MKYHTIRKKSVEIDPKALDEFLKLRIEVQDLFVALFRILERDGQLREPDAKKIRGYDNLFELRIRNSGQWRGFYGYIKQNRVIIVHFFHKKTQLLPQKELRIAIKRLTKYE